MPTRINGINVLESLKTSGGEDVRDTDHQHRQSRESRTSPLADRPQARNSSAGTTRDLINVKGALFPDHDNGTSAAASSSSGGRRGSGALSSLSSRHNSLIQDRPQITALPGFPANSSGGKGSSSKSLKQLDNDIFWSRKPQLALTYNHTARSRSSAGDKDKPLSSIVGGQPSRNNIGTYFNREMACRVAGALPLAPSRGAYNNNSSSRNNNSKAEELAEQEARNVARAIQGDDPPSSLTMYHRPSHP